MRTGTVSAISVLLISICSPHPATAQSNASSPSMPQTSPQKAAGPARLVELPKGAEIRSVPLRTDSTNGPTNPPQSWNLLAQQNRSSVDQLWSFKNGILPLLADARPSVPALPSEICSATGLKHSGDGAPPGAPGKGSQPSHCNLCPFNAERSPAISGAAPALVCPMPACGQAPAFF